ncbi:hypothetical protein OKW21_002815 [Catalinimonas alkaloidigena]|uniref:outer membrane beta-barrel protein n=1 Tax=Catalinimonas alkaloidigena TaxID=1075417 RepID=UPI00240606D4|nr:outer membrane beta-barrel protein [Catalinimonas alkaloidigena]MDF9797552.1 hypothetical protein [Catalinimonas alkaloidigena]
MTKQLKTIGYVLILILFMSNEASSQILFGPKLGYQTNWARYAKLFEGADYTSGMAYSPQFGALYSFKLSDQLSFYSELYYAQRGKKEKTNELITLKRIHDASYHFLEMPLMLRLTFPLRKEPKSPRIYVNAGPHIAYWLGGKGNLTSLETYGSTDLVKTEYQIQFLAPNSQENILYAEDANRLQFGLSAGTGIEVPVNRRGDIFQFDLRYTWGSTFMGSNLDLPIGTTDVDENYSFGHSQLSVSVAYAMYLDIWGMRRGKSIKRR